MDLACLLSITVSLELKLKSKHVVQRMERSGGIYVPPDVVPGRHVFFTVDNIDFAKDTPDSKHTLHGTAMAIYQRKDHEDLAPELR